MQHGVLQAMLRDSFEDFLEHRRRRLRIAGEQAHAEADLGVEQQVRISSFGPPPLAECNRRARMPYRGLGLAEIAREVAEIILQGHPLVIGPSIQLSA